MYKTYVCLPYNFEKNLFHEYHEKKNIYRYKKVLRQGYIPVFTNRTVVTMASLRFTNTLQPTNYTIYHFYSNDN